MLSSYFVRILSNDLNFGRGDTVVFSLITFKDDESINGEVLKTTFARIVASGTLIELETFTLWQKARFC